ncbi:MAG: alpha/beta hydrolase [Xanthobacteraceae bacterium]|nr:alpha/beta hydrolase [Xanthobacteraceae bacterium]
MTAELTNPVAGSDRVHRPRRQVLAVTLGVLAALIAALGITYFAAVHWGIRHEMVLLYDTVRKRPVDVDIAVRRDVQIRADAGMLTMPVVVINHGNTVRFTEYSFLSNFFAARGYLAISIQHDLSTDAPLMTKPGELFVGRMPVYQRGAENIMFVLNELEKRQPHANYEHVVLVGHSNGGDIAMYFAKIHPEMVTKVITLDNLRVPLQGTFKILSFRSEDPNFVPDPGVVPSPEICEKTGVTIVDTKFRHTDMSDRGPETLKTRIEDTLGKFLDDRGNSDLSPVATDNIAVPDP